MKFSPIMTSKYIRRCEDEQNDVEVADNNVICKEITARQVTQ